MDCKIDIRDSIDFIEKHLCEDIKLDDLARRSYFSEFHFHRLFRGEMGTTVMNYIRKRRLSEAAAELSRTEEQITDIALKYQFGSEESFSRSFKKAYGLCPRDYRNAARTAVRIVERNASGTAVTTAVSSSARASSGRASSGGAVMCLAA